MSNLPVKRLGNVGLYVVQGDITKIKSDAIMTAINSGGMWFGGVDGAIQRVAGTHYHQQAMNAMPLKDLQTIVAKGQRSAKHGFNDVVFVVDDLESPVSKVVYNGLVAAHKENYGNILIPAIRMGVMAGAVEKTPRETVDKIGDGLMKFMKEYGEKTTLRDLTFVIYSNPRAAQQLESGLGALHGLN